MQFQSIPFADLDAIDNRIATLGRGLGALRLAIGEGLLRLTSGAIQDFGFPTFESYVREALGRTGRWGADVRGLARRLEALPHLRTALASGHLSLSVVELVARMATSIDDAEWVERAATMNVRQLRADIKARKLEVFDDTTPVRISIATTVDRIDMWAFEQARMMIEAVGARRGDETIEAMLAEGLGTLLAADADIDLPTSLIGDTPDERASNLELAELRERAEAAVEAIRPNDPVSPPTAFDISWSDDPSAIDAQLRALATTLAQRDIELGALACTIVDCEVWRTFGYGTFDHYCRERIGLAPSSVATRIALTRRFATLPEVRTALAGGRIHYESATLIARVSGPTTVHAWVERATERTVKQLREDVDAIELLARLEARNASTLPPPDVDTRDALDDVERTVIASMCGLADHGLSQMSGAAPEAGPTTLHLSLSESTGQFWRALERLHGQMSGGAPFVPFLVRAALDTWRDTIDGHVAYADVYLRDRWRCASPVCRSRSVTPHHIRFRSHGGGEERTNLVSLCERCHLELVHGNKLRVTGQAPRALSWQARGWAA